MELKFQKFELKKIACPNFCMNPMEFKDYLDFDVKRIYFITDITGPTGAHCHEKEKEFFIVIKGKATAVIDRGNGLENIEMETSTGIYVGQYVWHHFKDFSPDAVLLALSSTNYDATRADYIENYEEYKKVVTAK